MILLVAMSPRNKDQIIAQILEICLKSGVTKTHVVYQSNLNFRTVVPYLSLLTGRGLLEMVPGKFKIYKTTPKGKRALKAFNAIEKMVAERLE